MPDGTSRFKDSEGKDIFHFMGYVVHVGINIAYFGAFYMVCFVPLVRYLVRTFQTNKNIAANLTFSYI